MKRILTMISVFIVILSLSACKKNKDVNVNSDNSNSAASSTVSDTIVEVKPTGDETNDTPPTGGEISESDANNPGNESSADSSGTIGKQHPAHTYKKAVVPATCEKDGFTKYTCDCGASYTDDTVLATGHKYGDWKETKAPTESSVGKEERTCKNCKKKETRDIPKLIPGHTHSYTAKVTTEPSCTSEGIKTFSCSCGASYTETIGKTGHKYTDTVVAPTCTTPGYTKHTCSGCNKTYYDSNVKVIPHKYTDEVVAPTCTSGGYTTHTCSVCNHKYTDSKKSELGHDYDSNVVKATCTSDGYTTHKCKRCGHYYTDNKTSATGHKNIKTDKKAATCMFGGYEKQVCADCGAIIKEVTIPETGKHTYVAKTCKDAYWEVVNNNMTFYHKMLGNYQHRTDLMCNICTQCHCIKQGKDTDVWSKYSDEEQSKLMLKYVNELRQQKKASDPGFYNIIYDKVELVYDAKLTELANIRAKEISVMYGHYEPNATITGAFECISHGQNSIEDAFNDWKNSSEHNKIMVEKSGVRFGYGRYVTENGNIFNVLLVWDKHHDASNYDD